MPYVNRAGQPALYYEIDDFTDPWRDAPYLVLQHGFGRNSRFWYSWVPYLSRFYKVVRTDLRGLGKSGRDFDLTHGISLDAYVEDVVAIIDHLGADTVHYCGEVLGGIIGMAFAASQPQRLRSLTLVSAHLYLPESTLKTYAMGYASWQEALKQMGVSQWVKATSPATRFPAGTDPGLNEWYESEMSQDAEVLEAIANVGSRVDMRPYLARIAAPVLGIYPSGAKITSEEQLAALRRDLRDVRIIRLQPTTQMLQYLQPATCATHVLHFISQVDGRPCHEA
jgi:3-oxoadipate enol-lactonase